MTWPTSKWLSLVIAYLLVVTETWGANSSAERSYLQPTGGDDKDNYDVIDVANQKSNDGLNKMLTGQTTRIVLTGDVDDEFWLKHLGEDYKHAVHLMVGGRNDPQNPYRSQHNSNSELYGVQSTIENHATKTKTEPVYYEPKIDVQHVTKSEQHATYVDNQNVATKASEQDFDIKTKVKEPQELSEQVNETPKESPVENMEKAENVEPAEPVSNTTEITAMTEVTNSVNTTEPHVVKSIEIGPNNDDADSKNTSIPVTKNDTEHVAPKKTYPEEKNSYEDIFDIGDKLATTFYNPNSFNLPDEKPHKNFHYTDILHKYTTHNKYTHSDSHTDYKHNPTEQHATDDREYSGDGGDHLDESRFLTNTQQKPVVINLPDTAKSIVQQLSDAVTPVVVKMPPVIYHQKAKQYYRPSKQQSTLNNHTPQNNQPDTQQQTLSYPLSQRYARYYSQPQTQQHQQQQQQQQQHLYPSYQNSFYNPISANTYDQSSYSGQNLYQPSSQMLNEQTVDSIPSLRYILDKSSSEIPPYAELHKQLQNNADSSLYDGYTRVSRSYRKYFNDGL